MKKALFIALSFPFILAGCGKDKTPESVIPKRVIFFLGDGMGIATQTAARIYSVGEEGALTMDNLPETAFVHTYSNDSQVTDSAPSMSAYMTGVKMNNGVISMSSDTQNSASCSAENGKAVTTLLELAEKAGLATGAVTTTRITHATPAATYAHTCNRDLEDNIATQMVVGHANYNAALGDGLEVAFGGGRQNFLGTADGGKRADGVNLVKAMQTAGYQYAANRADFDALDASKVTKALGLFSTSHMSYDLDRDATKEPSLAEMSVKAVQILNKNPKGYFLMVEGGRIDHALHETTAKKALQDTVAFDEAIKAVIAEAQKSDPTMANTTIVVTADHDHTLVLNGYAKRLGKSTTTEAGVLGVVKDPVSGTITKDADGKPYTIIGFGNGENRVNANRNTMADITDSNSAANSYHQEAAIRMPAGSETHGGTDVWLGATGKGAEAFHGFLDNTAVFGLIRQFAGI